jgi:hypothetical protein
MAAAKGPWKTGTSSGHITNLKQSILETFNIYGFLFYLVMIKMLQTNFKQLLGWGALHLAGESL